MDNDKILSIISNELEHSSFRDSDVYNVQIPLAYYLGLPNGTEIEGRSTITSTDVADAIEWIMPQIMKSFTHNNEIVVFDPVHEGDEKQADLESEYVYDVLMKQNEGFICLHQFIKDALMQRNGILKIYYEEEDDVKTESYSGLNEIQVQMLAAQENVDILSMSQDVDEMGMLVFSVKVSITEKKGKVCVESVPIEQFRLNSDHNSISLEKARFTAHIVRKTISELIEEGYDKDILDDLATSDDNLNDYRFQDQNEVTNWASGYASLDKSLRLVTLVEAYMYMDANEDGIAEYVKICAAGNENIPTHILAIDEIDYSPWIGTTPILMSHKFQGLSVFDRLKQIQDQKTSLWRNIMDNMYLQNNQRMLIVNGQVNIDDLLVSRPGGIIRTDSLDAVMPLQTPQIGPVAFDMMRYLDEVRGGRSGVSPEGAATQNNIGNKVGSEGVDRLMTAKEELVGLIVRVISETGIKPACIKIRDLLCKHIDAIQDFKFRGQWVKVNPAQWSSRSRCTVRVGTGTGDNRAKLGAIRELLGLQQQIISMPGQALLKPENVYKTLDDFYKFSAILRPSFAA